MKRSLAWFAGIVGIAALGRMLSKRKAVPDQPAPSATTPEPVVDQLTDPAEELRRRLAANRQPDTPETAEAEAVETLEERRARVHAKAREAIDAMSDEEATE